jgi:hypothetical protein
MLMDHHRPTAIAIPLETWLAKRSILMERYHYLRPQDLDLVPGREDELIQRLQRLLFMARKAVVDLIHND